MALTLETMSWIAGIAAVPVAVVLAVIGWSKSGKQKTNNSTVGKGGTAISGDLRDLLERGNGKRASITRGHTRIPARASMPFDWPDERCLSRLQERSRRAPRLRRSRCSLQSAMADHFRR
jgi:hypothetical protein